MTIGERWACKDCGAAPCDCKKAIWSFRYRNTVSGKEDWSHGGTRYNRKEAVVWQRHHTTNGSGYEIGPVQRITEPAYDFDSVVHTKPLAGQPMPIRVHAAPTIRDAAHLANLALRGDGVATWKA